MWKQKALRFIRKIFPATNEHYFALEQISFIGIGFGPDDPADVREGLLAAKTLLLTFAQEVDAFAPETGVEFPPADTTGISRLLQLLGRFSQAVRSLRDRRDGRAPLVMNDEYDVQYLLHALLLTHFDDVRPEDPSPNRAGASARMDFFLANESIIVEAKMTRDRLDDKKLGEELVIDAHRYDARLDCSALVCFVYDPERRLKNPAGIIRDVERTSSRLTVRVIIVS